MFRITIDFRQVERFLDDLHDVVTGLGTHGNRALASLARIAAEEMRGYFDVGGTKTVKWPETNWRWQQLRPEHKRTLVGTGALQGSVTGFPLPTGQAGVRVGAGDNSAPTGSSLAGAQRHQFGDAAFGMTWWWTAPVAGTGSDMHIVPSGSLLASFHPRIQARPFLEISEETVGNWWEDVGADLGFR